MGVELSASATLPEKRAPVSIRYGVSVDSRTGQDAVKKRNIFCPSKTSKRDSTGIQLAA
jgi:hypothetical protein